MVEENCSNNVRQVCLWYAGLENACTKLEFSLYVLRFPKAAKGEKSMHLY
jgi:hypothetical protein